MKTAVKKNGFLKENYIYSILKNIILHVCVCVCVPFPQRFNTIFVHYVCVCVYLYIRYFEFLSAE